MKIKLTGKWLKNMKIRTQLLSSLLFVILITIIVLVTALVNINKLTNTTEDMFTDVIFPLDSFSQATQMIESVKGEGRASLLLADAQLRVSAADNIIKDMEQVRQIAVDTVDGKIIKQEAQPHYDNLLKSIEHYTTLMKDFKALLSLDFSVQANQTSAVDYINNVLAPISTTCLEELSVLSNIKLGVGEDMANETIANANIAFYAIIVISIIGIITAICLALYFSACLSAPLLYGVEVMEKAASGDFSVSLPNDYGAEIGKLYHAANSLLAYSRSNVENISDASVTMRASAENMLRMSSQMESNSKSLNEQTASVSITIEEFSAGMVQSSNSLSTATTHIGAVASSIEEINLTIGTVAAASEQTSTRVEQASQLVSTINNSIRMASDSSTLVSTSFNNVAKSVDGINKSLITVNEHCMGAMQRISQADERVKSTNDVIKNLESASRQIGKIVNIINDIADQTNILALNAAIEAAGAGEAGKGFMIVANEVKELAKQTADSTDDIAEQIENMQRNMPEAVNAVAEITAIINDFSAFMKSLTSEVEHQGRRSDKINEDSAVAAQKMSEISDELTRISKNAISVSETVSESTKGVNEIAKSTAELAIGAQEIAMNAERASSNIREIDYATKEMSAGLVDISKNILLIHAESGEVQDTANKAKCSSEKLLESANAMESFASAFILN